MDDVADPSGSPASAAESAESVYPDVEMVAAETAANGSEGTVGEPFAESPIVEEEPPAEALLPDSQPLIPASQPESPLALEEGPGEEPNQSAFVDGSGTEEPVDSETLLACLKLKLQAKQMTLILVNSLFLALVPIFHNFHDFHIFSFAIGFLITFVCQVFCFVPVFIYILSVCFFNPESR